MAVFATAGYGISSDMEGVRAGEARTFGGVEMVWCPPTDVYGFVMGSPEREAGRADDEKQVSVKLTRGFWVAKYECTQVQWETVMGNNPSKFKGDGLPVESVSWNEVQVWLSKMNEQHPLPAGWVWALPTEAQWEYACRAGTKEAYSGDLFRIAWYGLSSSNGKTFTVGQKKPNGWGFYDMHGNVSEWCADLHGEFDRVHRGGGWMSIANDCRSANRDGADSDDRSDSLGFRVAIIERLHGATKEYPYVNSLGLEFVPVPGKAGVWMCRTETRVRDFRTYAEATDYVQTGGAHVLTFKDGNPSMAFDEAASWEKPGFAQSEDHPVVCVSWEEARTMAAWLSQEEPGLTYRLPTDAEWSAAVGGLGKYPWGSAWPPPEGAGNYSYYPDDGAEHTARVAQYAENSFGFFDLGGNVWEWCEDPYRASMNDADVLEAYPFLKEENSEGSPHRVLRGGSWDNFAEIYLRSSCRSLGRPSVRIGIYGFRFVVSVGVGG